MNQSMKGHTSFNLDVFARSMHYTNDELFADNEFFQYKTTEFSDLKSVSLLIHVMMCVLITS